MTTNYTFGGYPLSFIPKGDDIIIKCKFVTGLYSQIKAFLDNKHSSKAIFGIDPQKQCHISTDIHNASNIRIACLTDTYEHLHELSNHCETLLNNNQNG